LIAILTPLSSIGSGKLRSSEPTAVLGVMACGAEKLSIVKSPGPTPSTAGGVVGVGDGLPVGVGVGVGVGVVVGEGVGVGDVSIGSPLAPVAYETLTPVTGVDGGTSR